MRHSLLLGLVAIAASVTGAFGQTYGASGPLTLLTGELPNCLRARTPDNPLPCVPPDLEPGQPPAAVERRVRERVEGYAIHHRPDLARREIETALARTPRSAALWHMSARLHLTQGEEGAPKAAAIADLARALELSPDDGDIIATNAPLKSTEPRRRLAEYERALERAPNNVVALAAIHHLARDLGDETRAATALTRIAELSPKHPLAVANAMETRILRRGPPRSPTASEDAKLPADAPFSLRLQRIALLQATGHHAGAAEDLEAILGPVGASLRYALSPHQIAKLRFARALSLRELRRNVEAREEIASALQNGDQRLLLRIAVFLVTRGFPELPVTGELTPDLEAAAYSCMLNVACGTGLTRLI